MPERGCCPRCGRPPVVCFCAQVRPLATRTRVVLLQHPKERKVGVGTARMAHLALSNSVLRVGTDFSADRVVREALAAAPPVCVLFPKPGALDVAELPRDRPVTLVVLDGTWSLARKLLRFNPALAALPHVAFSPRRPSQYRIRRQPAAMCLSTIEALAEVLTTMEPENGPFERLLEPFLAMVARQERFVNEIGARRHRRAIRPARPSRRQMLSARMTSDWQRLICVQGDSNAWPRRDPARQPPEIVHWVAHRPATGETLEWFLAPRRTLAPTTPNQIELTEARIRGGARISDWHGEWRNFLRPEDIVVSWGSFYLGLAEAEGLPLPPARLDLRREVLSLLRAEGKVARANTSATSATFATPATAAPGSAPASLRNEGTGRLRTVDACALALGVESPSLGLVGRAGRRLAALVAVLRSLTSAPSPPPRAAASPEPQVDE